MNDDGVLMWLMLGLGMVFAWLLILGGRLSHGQPLVWMGIGLAVVLAVIAGADYLLTWRRGK